MLGKQFATAILIKRGKSTMYIRDVYMFLLALLGRYRQKKFKMITFRLIDKSERVGDQQVEILTL